MHTYTYLESLFQAHRLTQHICNREFTAEDLGRYKFMKACVQVSEHRRVCLLLSALTPGCSGTETKETQTTPTPARRHSSHMSRFRSCLFKSERSASSLSQSEGIQSASAAEYQAGCRRVSSRSTDTVDSSALFMGTAGADEMASHWGLDFNRPNFYRSWRTRDTFNNCLLSAKMTTWGTGKGTRNFQGEGRRLGEECALVS